MNMKKSIILSAILMIIATLTACGSNTNSKNTAGDGKKASVTELTAEDFGNKVYNLDAETLTYLGNKPAIVDFTASWCGPCRQIAPILEELAAEYDGQVVIYKVDVDKCSDIAAAFGIQSIPAILYIPLNGEPQMTVGSRGKAQFKDEIQKILLNK